MQFGVTVILSRLLTPAEVGIFSITTVFIGIFHVFRDFGISNYLQQEKDLTPEKMRSAMGLLVTTSWLMATLIYLASDAVATFYGQPGIASVMRTLTISFVLLPFASFFYALLSRDLQAEKQAIVNILSTIAYATTCISLASMGFSYMAMAWANVVNIGVTILIYIPLRPKGISFIPSFRGWAKPIRFGGGSIIGRLVEQAYNSIPDLVLGKFSGAHSVGLFSRANGLVGIFLQIAGPTVNYNALPYIARNYHAQVSLGPILSKSTSYLTGIAWPAFILTGVFAEEIIVTLYGKGWLEAAPLVLILCIASAGRIGYSLCQTALTAIGRPYLSIIYSGIGTLARIALIYAFGAREISDFVLGLCLADLLTTPVAALLMARYLGFSLRMSLAAHAASLKVGFFCLSSAIFLKYAMPLNWPDFLRLSLAIAGMGSTWLFAVFYCKHPLREELIVLIQRILPLGLAQRISDFVAIEKTNG